ncbi:hypothetical protein GJ496_004595 [Pomphorhynchus laevis]|nr:hypothetical protein GJ496_004595 [Pomphorhynchus laevis]
MRTLSVEVKNVRQLCKVRPASAATICNTMLEIINGMRTVYFIGLIYRTFSPFLPKIYVIYLRNSKSVIDQAKRLLNSIESIYTELSQGKIPLTIPVVHQKRRNCPAKPNKPRSVLSNIQNLFKNNNDTIEHHHSQSIKRINETTMENATPECIMNDYERYKTDYLPALTNQEAENILKDIELRSSSSSTGTLTSSEIFGPIFTNIPLQNIENGFSKSMIDKLNKKRTIKRPDIFTDIDRRSVSSISGTSIIDEPLIFGPAAAIQSTPLKMPLQIQATKKSKKPVKYKRCQNLEMDKFQMREYKNRVNRKDIDIEFIFDRLEMELTLAKLSTTDDTPDTSLLRMVILPNDAINTSLSGFRDLPNQSRNSGYVGNELPSITSDNKKQAIYQSNRMSNVIRQDTSINFADDMFECNETNMTVENPIEVSSTFMIPENGCNFDKLYPEKSTKHIVSNMFIHILALKDLQQKLDNGIRQFPPYLSNYIKRPRARFKTTCNIDTYLNGT